MPGGAARVDPGRVDLEVERQLLSGPVRSIPAASVVVERDAEHAPALTMPRVNGPIVTAGAAAASWLARVSSLPGQPSSRPGSRRGAVSGAAGSRTEPCRTEPTVLLPTALPSRPLTSSTPSTQPPTRSSTASIAATATVAGLVSSVTLLDRLGGDQDAEPASLAPACFQLAMAGLAGALIIQAQPDLGVPAARSGIAEPGRTAGSPGRRGRSRPARPRPTSPSARWRRPPGSATPHRHRQAAGARCCLHSEGRGLHGDDHGPHRHGHHPGTRQHGHVLAGRAARAAAAAPGRALVITLVEQVTQMGAQVGRRVGGQRLDGAAVEHRR